MEDNETVVKAATTDRSFGAFAKFIGKHGWDFAKRAWRLDFVKSMALTWALRASPVWGAALVALADTYLGGS